MPAYSKGMVKEQRQRCEVRGLEGPELGFGADPTDNSGSVTSRSTALRAGRSEQESERVLKLKLEIIQAEREARREQWEIEKERLSMQASNPENTRSSFVQSHGNIYQSLPRMSNNDRDVLTFLHKFERVMLSHGVDRTLWTRYILNRLNDQGRRAFLQLSLEECRDYDLVKRTLLTNFRQNDQAFVKPCNTLRGSDNKGPKMDLNHMRNGRTSNYEFNLIGSFMYEGQINKRGSQHTEQRLDRQTRELKCTTSRATRERDTNYYNELKSLMSMYDAVEHRAANECAADDDAVIDVVCNDAQSVLTDYCISDETVSEPVSEQGQPLLQNGKNTDVALSLIHI